MIPLSFIFAVFAITGILLQIQADDEYYRKLGVYIFLVFFLIMALQLLIDYPAQQGITAIIIIFSATMLIVILLLDLLKIFAFLVNWVQQRR